MIKKTELILEQIFRQGLIDVKCRFPPKDKSTLAMVYTPGVGACCMKIKEDSKKAYELTNKLNTMFVISDGSTMGSFVKVDPHLKKNPELQNEYHNLLSENNRMNTRFMLPLVEYHSYLYKAMINIDAYPLVFNHFIANPEDLLLSLECIATTTQGVELISVSKNIYEPILEKIDQIPIVTVLPINRRFLRKRLKNFTKNNFSQQYLINLIISLVAKFNMHSKRFGILKEDDLKEISDMLNKKNYFNHDIFQIMLESFKILQKNCHSGVDCLYIDNNFVMKNSLYKGRDIHQESVFMRIFKNFSNHENSLKVHEIFRGMIETRELLVSSDLNNLTMNFTSAAVKRFCLSLLTKSVAQQKELTISKNYCGIITDGTAILGFGDIGSLAGLPVMEGKISLFKELADVNVMPFSLISGLNLQDMKKVIKGFSDSWKAINLEDIAAPMCFDLEIELNQELPIPIFHDDQHGTAIVVLAGVINAMKITNKKPDASRVIINGAGAAGIAICNLMLYYGFTDITLMDSKGAIYEGRPDLPSNKFKQEISKKTNLSKLEGKLDTIIDGADLFIGVSRGNVLSVEMVKTMGPDSIVFALANPTPEIYPDQAKLGGAKVVATGRSDFPNQINNSLVFPGIFRGLIESDTKDVDLDLKVKAATALASVIEEPTADFIIPASLNIDISKIIAQHIKGEKMKPKL